MNCPNCGAPMRLREGAGCLNCDYCGSTYVPEKNKDGARLLGETSGLQCPICALPLERAIIDRYPILYCTHCCGSLIPMPVFVSLVDDLRSQQKDTAEIPHPPDPQHLRRRIRCPNCNQAMDTHFYAGPGNVIIDDCSRCELNWLDNGELASIARAPDHSFESDSALDRL